MIYNKPFFEIWFCFSKGEVIVRARMDNHKPVYALQLYKYSLFVCVFFSL